MNNKESLNPKGSLKKRNQIIVKRKEELLRSQRRYELAKGSMIALIESSNYVGNSHIHVASDALRYADALLDCLDGHSVECTTTCGMNYCDENGCVNRRKNTVNGEPVTPNFGNLIS